MLEKGHFIFHNFTHHKLFWNNKLSSIQVHYSVMLSGTKCVCCKTETVMPNVTEPFSLDVKLLTVRLEETSMANTDEPFLVMPYIRYVHVTENKDVVPRIRIVNNAAATTDTPATIC